MRFLTSSVVLLPLLLVTPASLAADLAKIERTIGKEPAYRTKAPKYGLLAFGPEGKDRVWLVHDGDTLYVDRNGNGDLTEPGEKVAAEKEPGHDPEKDGYTFDVGELTAGGLTHKGLRVFFRPLKQLAEGVMGELPEVKATLAKNPKVLAATLQVEVQVPGIKGGEVGGRVSINVGANGLLGAPVFAGTLAEAPVIRLGGPLEITFYELPTLRIGRTSKVSLVVGSPGIGCGTFASVAYQDTIPESAKPVVEISFPAARPGAPPIKERYEIKDRC
jgi:hypothetical protein